MRSASGYRCLQRREARAGACCFARDGAAGSCRGDEGLLDDEPLDDELLDDELDEFDDESPEWVASAKTPSISAPKKSAPPLPESSSPEVSPEPSAVVRRSANHQQMDPSGSMPASQRPSSSATPGHIRRQSRKRRASPFEASSHAIAQSRGAGSASRNVETLNRV